MPSLKLIFAGTPEFSATALAALVDSPHQVIAVYTQPDRPAGRGLKLTYSPVKQLALDRKLPLFQPSTLKDPAEQEKLAALKADAMIVAAYGLILPAAVLSAPRLGCINIHPSLLPRWRGATPIQRTILAGDSRTGVSIMKMEEGVDSGPVLLKAEYTLKTDETSESLHQRLAELGATTLLKTLDRYAEGSLSPQPQDPAKATHAPKITKEEARIDWNKPALELERLVRAFYPWPIAYTLFQDETLRIHSALALPQLSPAKPGTIVAAEAEGLDVATGKGLLRLRRIQAPGGRVLAIADFLNARQKDLLIGNCFA